MLSAVMQRLKLLKQESSPDMRQAAIDLCASAYPDVQPWQVQIQCRPVSGSVEEMKILSDLYYSYLSLLLHPLDGHETARRNVDLVNNWCELSVEKLEDDDVKKPMEFKSNFLAVASLASSTHKAYQRDLVLLLKLSMRINETDLVLDLGKKTVLFRFFLKNIPLIFNLLCFLKYSQPERFLMTLFFQRIKRLSTKSLTASARLVASRLDLYHHQVHAC